MARSRSTRTERALALTLSLALSATAPAAGAGPAAPGSRSPAPPSRLVRKGVALHNAGRYAEALALFQEAYQADPTLTRLLLLIGACHLNLGRLQDAQDTYERFEDEAAPRQADDEEARRKLRAYAQELAARASEELRRASSPGRFELHLLIGRAYIIQGGDRLADAVAALERYAQAAPRTGPAAQAHRARLQAAYERLLPRLERALQQSGGRQPELLLLLSKVCAGMGRRYEAERYAEQHLRLVSPQAPEPDPAAQRRPAPPPAPTGAGPARPVWRLVTGGVALGGGLVIAGFGVSALSVNGACARTQPPLPERPECAEIYDTSTVGGALLGAGLPLAVAGALLIALPDLRQRRRAR
jgi:tetratricopeptide (TPR) repeat protein